MTSLFQYAQRLVTQWYEKEAIAVAFTVNGATAGALVSAQHKEIPCSLFNDRSRQWLQDPTNGFNTVIGRSVFGAVIGGTYGICAWYIFPISGPLVAVYWERKHSSC
jgi:hypothetical protein